MPKDTPEAGTTFQRIAPPDAPGDLSEPILCTFPQNPPAKLSHMRFDIYEQENSKQKKRILKSAHKSLKFSATSNHADTRPKGQGSDYYVGIYDSTKDRCYLMPVSATYQLH